MEFVARHDLARGRHFSIFEHQLASDHHVIDAASIDFGSFIRGEVGDRAWIKDGEAGDHLWAHDAAVAQADPLGGGGGEAWQSRTKNKRCIVRRLVRS